MCGTAWRLNMGLFDVFVTYAGGTSCIYDHDLLYIASICVNNIILLNYKQEKKKKQAGEIEIGFIINFFGGVDNQFMLLNVRLSMCKQ